LTSVSQITGLNITVFLNPFIDQVEVEVDRPVELNWELMDVNGWRIASGQDIYQLAVLNFSGAPPGIYFLEIVHSASGNHLVQRLIKGR